jgi:hypothetical protein
LNTEDFVSIDDPTSFVWKVQLYQFDLSVSNLFFFWVNIYQPDAAASTYFNIANTNQSESSSATATTLPSSTRTIQPPTSSSLPPAPNGTSIDTRGILGIALGIGMPAVISILAITFVLLKRVKSKRPHEQKLEVDISRSPYQLLQTVKPPVETNGDFSHRAEELESGYRSIDAELPANSIT